MDWQRWIAQHLPFTEIKRGGATVWPKGGNGLIGDALGPVLHSHDNASEIFYFISGRGRLEIGNTEEYMSPGDFILVPPDVPHNLWNAGNDDLLVFWLVAPNFIHNKWRTENFAPGAMDLRGIRASLQDDEQLPSDWNIRTRLVRLTSDARLNSEGQAQLGAEGHAAAGVLTMGKVTDLLGLKGKTGEQQEAVIYVVEGEARVQIGQLSGVLRPNEFVNVQTGTDFSVSPRGETARVLFIEMPGEA